MLEYMIGKLKTKLVLTFPQTSNIQLIKNS